MFGLFRPRSPLRTSEKAWTERTMRWFAERLGLDTMLRATVVLPTEEFFPEPFRADKEYTRRLLDRLCGYMDVDPAAVRLQVCDDAQLPGAAGQWQQGPRATVRIAHSQLGEPDRLVATLAHELAHEILLGRGLIDPNSPDHENVTDLLPVYLGVGLFAANSTVKDAAWHVGNWEYWQINRQGYLPSRILGYALALFAFVRGERDPGWASFLRPDAAEPLREGLRYLVKTGDTLFHPDTADLRLEKRSDPELFAALGDRSPTVRLDTLWELCERGPAAAEAVEAVTSRLDDEDPDIPGAAARALGAFGRPSLPAVPLLIGALDSTHASTRSGAAWALGCLTPEPRFVVPALARLLRDEDRTVVFEAAGALNGYRQESAVAAPQLFQALAKSLVECDDWIADHLARTIVAVVPDLKRQLRLHLGHDEELRQQAIEVLKAERRRVRQEQNPESAEEPS